MNWTLAYKYYEMWKCKKKWNRENDAIKFSCGSILLVQHLPSRRQNSHQQKPIIFLGKKEMLDDCLWPSITAATDQLFQKVFKHWQANSKHYQIFCTVRYRLSNSLLLMVLLFVIQSHQVERNVSLGSLPQTFPMPNFIFFCKQYVTLNVRNSKIFLWSFQSLFVSLSSEKDTRRRRRSFRRVVWLLYI